MELAIGILSVIQVELFQDQGGGGESSADTSEEIYSQIQSILERFLYLLTLQLPFL